MAADDDKISNNRRRLFKALSAVPVVATLRPGEALANHSAYQCIAKIAENEIETVWIDCGGNDCSPLLDQTGSAYKELWFCDPLNDGADPVPATGAGCHQRVNGPIVEVRPSSNPNGANYRNLLGEKVTQFMEVTYDGAGNPLTADFFDRNTDNANALRCRVDVPFRKGLFARLFQPVDDNGSLVTADQATGAAKAGVFPTAQLGEDGRQLMTGTCWTSITGGNQVPNAWRLVRG